MENKNISCRTGQQPKQGRSAPNCALPLFFLLSLLAFTLSGCVSMRDTETSQEQSGQIGGSTAFGRDLSQTFTAHRSGLNEVTVWAGRTNGAEGDQISLRFELYAGDEPAPRYSTETLFHSDGAQVFSFPPQNDPPGQIYRIQLTAQGDELHFFGRAEDNYPYGQAFAESQPLDTDLAFRTTYFYGPSAVLEDLVRLSGQIWLLLPLGLVLLGPGWLLLDVLDLRKHFDAGEQSALSLALGLALLPLLMLWSSTLGLRWSWAAVIAGGVLVIAVIFWQVLRRPFRFSISWAGLALAGIFLLTLWLRFATVRDLAAPAWVDSVHHALITRLIMNSGGFPETYAPYFALGPTQYHAGFHSGLAVFSWLSRLDLPDALMFYGQTLSAAAVLAVYLLTTTLTGSRNAGLAAALITGLVTPMPAYYASWGRYTQLAGLLILSAAPALLRLAWEKEEKGLHWKALLAAGLSLGGLLLVHYRVTAFAALLMVAYVLSQIPFNRAGLRSFGGKTALYGGLLFMGPLLLSAPWSIPTLSQHIFPALAPDQVIETAAFNDFAWRYLTAGLGSYSLFLALVGLVWAGWKRQRFALAVLFWVALLFLLANLGALGLPGAGFVNNTSVQIALFMPVSLLGGFAFASIWKAWPSRVSVKARPVYRSLLGLALATLLVLGARQLLTILNPVTELFRAADRPAMDWIRSHVPEEEIILINPFNWGYGVYAGADGGYWISPLTGRATLPPPVLYGMGPGPEIRQIAELGRQVTTYSGSPSELSGLMLENDLRYIYLGARGGVISAQALNNSPLFRLVYEANNVRIFLLQDEREEDNGRKPP
jgi:hypothetical protein